MGRGACPPGQDRLFAIVRLPARAEPLPRDCALACRCPAARGRRLGDGAPAGWDRSVGLAGRRSRWGVSTGRGSIGELPSFELVVGGGV